MYNLIAVTPQCTDQRRRNAKSSDLVIRTQFPNPIRSRKIGRAIVKQHRRAEQQRSENLPRPHHPAHVCHPEKRFVGVKIETMPHVLRGFDRKAAMCVHRALWSTGRARCVDDHHRVFGGGTFGRFVRRLIVDLVDEFAPQMRSVGEAVSFPFCFGREPNRFPYRSVLQHDQMLQRRNLRGHFIGNRFHRTKFSAPISSIGGEKCFGVAVF